MLEIPGPVFVTPRPGIVYSILNCRGVYKCRIVVFSEVIYEIINYGTRNCGIKIRIKL